MARGFAKDRTKERDQYHLSRDQPRLVPIGHRKYLSRPRKETLRISGLAAHHREAEEILARFDIHIDVRQPLSRYTTAIQQMVAIARAVSFQAKLVIMDEPTSSLADHEVAILFGVIRQLKESGVSVIFVSHKLNELFAVCQRVTVMRDGRTVLVASLTEVSKLKLVTTMIGRELEVAAAEQTGFHDIAETHRKEKAKSLLEVQNLAVGRRVSDVSFDVHPGEIVGLADCLGPVGPNRCARCLEPTSPTPGKCVIANPFAPQSPADAIARASDFAQRTASSKGSYRTCRSRKI